MPPESGIDRLLSALERLMFGQRESLYRQFVRATGVVTAALVAAFLLARFGVAGLSPAVARVFRTAATIAVATYVLAGVVQFVVLARAYERRATTVAETADEIEDAAETVAAAAEQVDDATERVERAAETDSEIAEDVTAETEAVREEAESAKEAADEVRATVEREREHLPDADERAE